MALGLDVRLRVERAKIKMTQEKVAEAIGVAASTISAYENGTAMPPSDVLMRFCLLYGVSADYLLGIQSQRVLSVDGLDEQQVDMVKNLTEYLREINLQLSGR